MALVPPISISNLHFPLWASSNTQASRVVPSLPGDLTACGDSQSWFPTEWNHDGPLSYSLPLGTRISKTCGDMNQKFFKWIIRCKSEKNLFYLDTLILRSMNSVRRDVREMALLFWPLVFRIFTLTTSFKVSCNCKGVCRSSFHKHMNDGVVNVVDKNPFSYFICIQWII